MNTTHNKLDKSIPDNRNVTDFYKYWQTADILANLDTKRENYSILCCNISGDFNLGSIVRSSNAFLAKEVFIYGKKHWDRRSAVGTQNYIKFNHVKITDNLDEIFSRFDEIIAIDNVENSTKIHEHKWDKKKNTLICFGEENSGVALDILNRCHKILYIEQLGSVRSLNVGAAASIVMYDYFCKTR
jgi:tRNA G18 (ribose-2'-O)-methylase SpoU